LSQNIDPQIRWVCEGGHHQCSWNENES